MELNKFVFCIHKLKKSKFKRKTLKYHLTLLIGKVQTRKKITENLLTKRNGLPIFLGGGVVFKDFILFLIMCMWVCLCMGI